METIQAIRSRRSIRKYQPKPVPHEVIEQIVADAAYALLRQNTQIGRYVLVADRTTLDKRAQVMVETRHRMKLISRNVRSESDMG